MKLDKYYVIEKYIFTNKSTFDLHRIRHCYRFIMTIDLEKFNKPTMPVNAETYLTRAGFALTTSTTPPSSLALLHPSPLPTALSRQPQ